LVISALKLHAVRPNHPNLRFALGDLEAIVLRQLWESKRPLSVRESQSRTARSRPVAVTTVATILDRLFRKGLVSRHLAREGSPHYLYSPKVTEEEFKQAVVKNVMEGLLQGFNDVTVAYLAERMSVSDGNDLHIVSKYLNRLRKKEKK
jgi:predicted transcriptional regulator